MYDCKVALSVLLFPTNRSAALLKNLFKLFRVHFQCFLIGTKYAIYDFPYIIFVFDWNFF